MPNGATSTGHAPKALIDAHCHVFNASDLPAISFIRIVVRERFDATGSAMDLLIGLVTAILTGNAPSAASELAAIEAGVAAAASTLADSYVDEMALSQPEEIVTGAEPSSEIKRLVGWLRLFKKSRRELVDMLETIYSQSGRTCVLMAPALVDYNAWLHEPEQKDQRLPDQVRVMGAIARLPGKTRVHGFVGFDPVRAILADVDRVPAGAEGLEAFKPLDLIDEAVSKHGFLGVKLYPPMGFRAWNNGAGDITFPDKVKHDVNSSGIGDRDLGRLIDHQLSKLYRYCAAEGVPILAHCANSNQVGSCYGWRASPQYWDKVIEKFSTTEKPLRICLAHLCSFNAHRHNTACLPPGSIPKVWEDVFGKIIDRPEGEYAFADMSYFQELLDRESGWQQRRKALLDQFKKFLDLSSSPLDHLCYGSDWIMLGVEKRHQYHHEEVAELLHDAGCSSADISKVFFGNALKLFGLREGEQGRSRLEKFYWENEIKQFFPQLDAMA